MAPIEPMSMSVVLTRGSDCTVVCVGGEHDLATVPLLWASLALAMTFDEGDLVVDLSGVRFMDASTVGVIMRARGLLRPRALRLRAPSRLAKSVLTICKLDDLVDPSASDGARTAGTALGTWVTVPRSDRAVPVPAVEGAVGAERASRIDRPGA
jgi:anti-anti-sigma factor